MEGGCIQEERGHYFQPEQLCCSSKGSGRDFCYRAHMVAQESKDRDDLGIDNREAICLSIQIESALPGCFNCYFFGFIFSLFFFCVQGPADNSIRERMGWWTLGKP